MSTSAILEYSNVKDDCNFVIILDDDAVDNLYACPNYQGQVESIELDQNRARFWLCPK